MRLLLLIIVASVVGAPAFAVECVTPRGEVATFPMASCPFGLTPKAGRPAQVPAAVTAPTVAQPSAPGASKQTPSETARQHAEQAQRAQADARAQALARTQAAARAQAATPQAVAPVTEMSAAAMALSRALAARRVQDPPGSSQ